MTALPSAKVILLNTPYDGLSDPAIWALLSGLLSFRLRGYRAHFPGGVLPFDNTDYCATHALICEPTEEGYILRGKMKLVTLAACQRHGIEFPILPLARTASGPGLLEQVEEIIHHCPSPEQIGYFSNWVVDPDLRQDRRWLELFRKMAWAFVVHLMDLHKLESATMCGLTSLNMPLFYRRMGARPLAEGSLVRFDNLGGEEAEMLMMTEIPPKTRLIAEEMAPIWTERITLKPLEIAQGLDELPLIRC